MTHLASRAVDVVVTNAEASGSCVMGIARRAQQLQPGVRVIVLASTLTADDIVAALKNQVYTCFTLPAPPGELRSTITQALADDNWQSGIEVISAVPHWIALRVACRRVNAERLTHFMNELAGDLSATERYQLITAFREVLLNAMEHGAGFDPDKVVEVHAVRTRRTLVYYFKDPGPGFDVHAPQMVASEDDPLSHLDERAAQGKRAGGFGLLLTSKLIDEVQYNELGNEVILVKHLD
jgi:anti-sigma regulatory factor (Ser/Thr protein kinase)